MNSRATKWWLYSPVPSIKHCASSNELGIRLFQPSPSGDRVTILGFLFTPWKSNWVAVSHFFFLIFTPTWGIDPIWRSYFLKWVVQPPTSKTSEFSLRNAPQDMKITPRSLADETSNCLWQLWCEFLFWWCLLGKPERQQDLIKLEPEH